MVTLRELVDNPGKLDELKGPDYRCSVCNGPIEEHPDELYRISGQPVCSDCYFGGLGKLIEQYPISSPRVGRGQTS